VLDCALLNNPGESSGHGACELDNEAALVSNARRGDPMHGAAGMPLFAEIS
jgi:hypothetical protein